MWRTASAPGNGGRDLRPVLCENARVANVTRQPNRTPRRVREQRAYRLGVVGAGAGVVTVGGGVLALIGIIGFTLPVIALLVAVACALLFRSTVSR